MVFPTAPSSAKTPPLHKATSCLTSERGRGWVYQAASEAKPNARFVRKLLLDRAKCTPDIPNRAAQRREFARLCDSTRISSTSPPFHAHAPSTFYMPATSAPDDPQQTRDAGPRRTTETRDIPLSSATHLRAPPRLPHLTFSSSDEKWRKPPARAASRSRSTKDRESRSALFAPAVDWEGHPAPQSRPERPRSREQEPRLTCNVRRWTVCFRGKCDILAVLYHATSA